MALKCDLHKIAYAIRKANGSKDKYSPINFHKEIGKLCYIDDNINGKIPIQEGGEILPVNGKTIIQGGTYLKEDIIINGEKSIARKFYIEDRLNEYYGMKVADVCRSYHLVKMGGHGSFRYSQEKGLLGNGQLTDEEGRCYIDCSGFVSLILRGIEFKDSPYFKALGTPNVFLKDLGLEQKVVYDLCLKSNHEWANRYLDKQKDKNLKDIGICGYYSIRNAGQLAEYYYSNGNVLYDIRRGDSLPSSLKLRAGDLIFQSKATAGEHQKKRFMSISHVSIVARDTTKYYQVTGYADERVTETIFCSNIKDMDEISLIVRPNYIPIKEQTPFNTNLLNKYVFDSLSISAATTLKGVTFEPQIEGGFSIERTSNTTNGHTTFYIIRESNPLRLEKGTYKLGGVPINNALTNSEHIQDYGMAVKEVNGDNLVWCKEGSKTFTIDNEKEVYVYFFLSQSATTNEKLYCIPTLERID